MTVRSSWTKRIFLLFIGLLTGCLAGEALLRLMNYEGVNLMSKDPILGQKYKPSMKTRIFDPEAGRNVSIQTNSIGFRDIEHNRTDSKSRKIVFLGDSFTAGFSVDWEKTFPQICRQVLDRQRPTEVMSLAAAGFGTAQEMLAFQEYGLKFQPQFVVLAFFAGNDVSDNSSELSTNPRIYFTLDPGGDLVQEPRNQLRGKASGWLNDYSRLYIWQKQQFRKIENYYKNRIQINPAHRVFMDNYDQRTQRAWLITFALLKKLNESVESSGATLLVSYIPFSDEVNPDWWKESYENSAAMSEHKWDLGKPEKMLSDFCIRNGIAFLSPRESFLKQSQEGKRLYFKHGHFNEAGHRQFGELIASSILEY